MGDESFGLLDGKSLSSLRVVDLKLELEKRGLPKSGSKKDLIKRLKQKLELEKLFSESSAAGSGGIEPRLQLDEATEQNEFVRQYLENQQKLYAQQKGFLEKQGRGDTEEEEDCEEEEESDSGAKDHESDVTEIVNVAIKSTCDSSTHESAEEGEKIPQNNNDAVALDCKTTEDTSAILDSGPQETENIGCSEIVRSDQESCSSGKPDSTELCIKSNEIGDSGKESSQSNPVLLTTVEQGDSTDMHPKKSKLKKLNEKSQKAVTVPATEGGSVNSVASKTNNGSDVTINCEGRIPDQDLIDCETEPMSLTKDIEKQVVSEICGNISNTSISSITEQSEDTEQGQKDGLHLMHEEANKETLTHKAAKSEFIFVPDEKQSTKENDSNKNEFLETCESPEVVPGEMEVDLITKSCGNEISNLNCDEERSTEEKSVSSSAKYHFEDQHAAVKNTDSREDEIHCALSKIQVDNEKHLSYGSSDTEDGESKTDDENAVSNKQSNSQEQDLVDKPTAVPVDAWQHAESESSSDSDSSCNDSRRKHKSYKSSKSEDNSDSIVSVVNEDNTNEIKDIGSKNQEKMESSEAEYKPRRLKIRRTPIMDSSVTGSKMVEKAKLPNISSEKFKDRFLSGAEDKSTGNWKSTELVAMSESVGKEKKSSREMGEKSGSFSNEKKEEQFKERNKTKVELKKRPANELTLADHTPAKVTYRKLNIPFKKNEEKEQDNREQMSDKKRLWRSFGSKTTVNISTDSLKTIIPDFKVVCGPSLNEAEDMPSPKIASDAPALTNKLHDDSFPEKPAGKMEIDEFENQRAAEKDAKDASEGHKRTVLPKKPISQTLFIQNLVRPFTLLQLKEMLKRTGKLIEEEFWIDKIKSKCFVTYENTDQAEETKEALNGTRWPPSNPKILSVEFASKEEMEYHKKLAEQAKGTVPVVPLQDRREKQEQVDHLPTDASRKRKEIEDPFREKEPHPRQAYVREWDKDKIAQEESPDKEKLFPPAKDKSRSSEKRKDKKDGRKRQDDDTPAKLLDDLFHKTKATPCIYWLPLTEDQAKEKEEQRKQRRLERERRNQEEEQRRTRRRRESRSRSPVRRR